MRSRSTRTLVIVALVALAAGWSLHLALAPGARSRHLQAGEFEALCARAIDGDTIELADGERVRYIGIDTPEMRPVEAWAEAATEANRELVEGRIVRLELDVQERDRYGRLLAYVWAGDLLVNEELLRRGLAQVLTYPPNVRYERRFLAAQRAAREAGRGLWADAAPPAP